MKYERLTQRVFGETYSVNQRIYYDDVADIVERLAELEDKIESGELVDRSELEKAVAAKQEKGQDVTVKTIFKFTDEIKALKAEIDEYKRKIKDGELVEFPRLSSETFDDIMPRVTVYSVETYNPELKPPFCYYSFTYDSKEEAEEKLKELKSEVEE